MIGASGDAIVESLLQVYVTGVYDRELGEGVKVTDRKKKKKFFFRKLKVETKRTGREG